MKRRGEKTTNEIRMNITSPVIAFGCFGSLVWSDRLVLCDLGRQEIKIQFLDLGCMVYRIIPIAEDNIGVRRWADARK